MPRTKLTARKSTDGKAPRKKLATKKVSAVKAPSSDTILNPKTGRYVKRDGAVGQKILKEMKPPVVLKLEWAKKKKSKSPAKRKKSKSPAKRKKSKSPAKRKKSKSPAKRKKSPVKGPSKEELYLASLLDRIRSDEAKELAKRKKVKSPASARFSRCEMSGAKKYRERNSPPYPAGPCCGQIMDGNDGELYISKPFGKKLGGSCRWVKYDAPLSGAGGSKIKIARGMSAMMDMEDL